jgi:hypothetical protein
MRKGCRLCVFNILISTCAASSWAQSNADYLESISSEAKSLVIDTETRSISETTAQKTVVQSASSNEGEIQTGAIMELVPGLSVDEFEILLKNNYMGSYLFYRGLDDNGRQETYDYYLQNPDPAKLRQKILQIKKQ